MSQLKWMGNLPLPPPQLKETRIQGQLKLARFQDFILFFMFRFGTSGEDLLISPPELKWMGNLKWMGQ
jgi:hypothetical protein